MYTDQTKSGPPRPHRNCVDSSTSKPESVSGGRERLVWLPSLLQVNCVIVLAPALAAHRDSARCRRRSKGRRCANPGQSLAGRAKYAGDPALRGSGRAPRGDREDHVDEGKERSPGNRGRICVPNWRCVAISQVHFPLVIVSRVEGRNEKD